MSAVECPVCGAAGSKPCRGGRDHKDRLTAERAAARANREPRPWDAGAVGRAIRAEGRRVARAGGEVDLAELAGLRAELEAAITDAVVGMRTAGNFSWEAIGGAFGVSRSAAFQRYGKAAEGSRPD